MHFSFRRLTEEDAHAVVGWQYDGPYAVYNSAAGDISGLLDLQNAYYGATSETGEFIGFCCFGPDARVPGGDYEGAERKTLDVGLGLRPDLTGTGHGLAFFNAILAFASSEFAPEAFRLTVAAFNKRAIRTYEKAGFERTHTFATKTARGQREFVQMIRAA